MGVQFHPLNASINMLDRFESKDLIVYRQKDDEITRQYSTTVKQIFCKQSNDSVSICILPADLSTSRVFAFSTKDTYAAVDGNLVLKSDDSYTILSGSDDVIYVQSVMDSLLHRELQLSDICCSYQFADYYEQQGLKSNIAKFRHLWQMMGGVTVAHFEEYTIKEHLKEDEETILSKTWEWPNYPRPILDKVPFRIFHIHEDLPDILSEFAGRVRISIMEFFDTPEGVIRCKESVLGIELEQPPIFQETRDEYRILFYSTRSMWLTLCFSKDPEITSVSDKELHISSESQKIELEVMEDKS